MNNEKTPWHVGQKAIIDRRTIVTIERVTPSGRAVVDGRMFEVDGMERAPGSFRRGMLESLTPEIQAEIDLIERGRKVVNNAHAAIKTVDQWLRQSFGMDRRVPEAADVDRAETIAAAIRGLMETP